jgi:hypothetical protein
VPPLPDAVEPVVELEPPDPVVVLVETDVVPVAVERPPTPPDALVVPPIVAPLLPPAPPVEPGSAGESEQARAVIPTEIQMESCFRRVMMKSPVAPSFGGKAMTGTASECAQAATGSTSLRSLSVAIVQG